MAHSRTITAGGAALLVALFAIGCAGTSTPEQTTAPAQTSQAPASAAPATDQAAAPATENATAPADQAAPPAAPADNAPQQGDQPHN